MDKDKASNIFIVVLLVATIIFGAYTIRGEWVESQEEDDDDDGPWSGWNHYKVVGQVQEIQTAIPINETTWWPTDSCVRVNITFISDWKLLVCIRGGDRAMLENITYGDFIEVTLVDVGVIIGIRELLPEEYKNPG